ncbi:MAG: DNA-binding response regulator [Candidatus Kapaibacterium sp.]|nr:MAG: DNA-binding response regulator [Candidatus Kapabacteria bacterium]
MIQDPITQDPITLCIVDDHELIRFAMESWIQQDLQTHSALRPIHVVGTAENGAEALELIPRVQPKVLLVDFQLPDMLGSEIISRLRAGGLEKSAMSILALTGMDNAPIKDILASGANGYLSKSESSTSIIQAIRHTAEKPHELWLNPAEAKKMVNADRALSMAGITPAEKNILKMLLFANEEIAETLDISRGTLKSHLNSIYQKLGINSREEAEEFATKIGLLPKVLR